MRQNILIVVGAIAVALALAWLFPETFMPRVYP